MRQYNQTYGLVQQPCHRKLCRKVRQYYQIYGLVQQSCHRK